MPAGRPDLHDPDNVQQMLAIGTGHKRAGMTVWHLMQGKMAQYFLEGYLSTTYDPGGLQWIDR